MDVAGTDMRRQIWGAVLLSVILNTNALFSQFSMVGCLVRLMSNGDKETKMFHFYTMPILLVNYFRHTRPKNNKY